VFVRADFYIYKHHKDYHVVFNTENIPVLKFSKQYAQSIRKMGNLKAKEKKYLTEKSYSALWFIRAVQQRQKKIKQIAYYLVEHQKEFFEKGFSYLQPLKMKNLAKTLGVHASTISRAIHNKYVYTPQGILSLKSFFQKGLVTKEGDFISISVVKEAVRNLIKNENPKQPLSDQQIRDKIEQIFQVDLLKRSISQYRSSMGLPPFKKRQPHSLYFENTGA